MAALFWCRSGSWSIAFQLCDAGNFALADQHKNALVNEILPNYATPGGDAGGKASLTGQVIIMALSVYKITGDPAHLALARAWADYGMQKFMADYPIPTELGEGSMYDKNWGGSEGGAIPGTLGLALLALGMEEHYPENRLQVINIAY
jgi:hypothetical protein